MFTLLLGAVFLLVGILTSLNSKLNYFLIMMGIVFIGWGISYLVSAKRLIQK
jgi:hypothetical protein